MDGNILLWIQDHFRWEGMNWFWKGITSLGNGDGSVCYAVNDRLKIGTAA